MHSKSIWKNIDILTVLIVLLISGLSLFVIGSATKPLLSPGSQLYFVHRQLAWIFLGLLTMAIVAWVPYEKFRVISPYLYWTSVLLLAFVLVKGHTALGAQRWINVGPFQLQPSEFAKIAIVITLATHLSQKQRLTHWKDFISPGLHVLLPMLLVLKQPDLGTTLVFVAITAGMLFMAGASWWKLVIIFPGGLLIVILWIYLHYRFHIPIPMHQYQLNRLIIFLNPNKDPLGAGFNVIQSRIAVGSGGLFGTGIFTAHFNQLSFLPESYTDFIFAVVAEELGFVGSMALLLVYLLLLARGIYIANQAKDRYGMLLATGVVSMFAFHVIESAGMVSGIMPVAGVPLPFMSYGGSAFLADSAGIGILLNVYMRRHDLSYNRSAPVTQVVYSKNT
ncbi:rod shape determining protein RodA [Sulfobacillus thermosulfidooxidans DSM 9293]|uniref:Peptidoglycan glycosyltransferase RodA n=1 Tax=Sulfobacillus thermosulfidooxidans (strain DSM 9293 / VKM B-1269 / AT-1) TaxID=929705 RepID=A0A1W1WA62_SULTA|nr:rod shape-determining protein RodA [Sulfobacillus thermosulfidooxidans]SMC02613.1 rod shape determining protein RodA [Sulfobacillus thermosulfidooxidans DSM 9293]